MELGTYEDPILKLIQDPNLNRDRDKTLQLHGIINGLTERRISKLCQTSLTILQTLEKINLKFSSWEFMSLDFNSDTHFDADDQIKSFNNFLADKILESCSELQNKVQKISIDLDYLTKTLKTLSPMEYISDAGTLLTSLLLRSIKLKNEVVESLTISYSKAKLMLIGKELEQMLVEEESTLLSYKLFIISLMKQLNSAIQQEDSESKYECLAVISDMESMFETFKLERFSESATNELNQVKDSQDIAVYKQQEKRDYDLEDSDYDLVGSYNSNPPLIHSITKDNDSAHKRLDSFNSTSSNQLYKTTIADEMPHLMNAFSSTKTIAEDLSHFQSETTPTKPIDINQSQEKKKHFYNHKPHLPSNPLYNESVILSQTPSPPKTPSLSYYNNSSLLSRLGIRPQVVSTNYTHKELINSTQPQRTIENDEEKENKQKVTPLTKENLYSWSRPDTKNSIKDLVD